MQFSLWSGQGTTDAIFIIRQFQEKYLAKNRKLCMAFVDLEKAFNRVSQKVLLLAFRVVGVPEWSVNARLYVGASSETLVSSSFSKKFEVKVALHQRS